MEPKVALITGASRGIGAAIARKLAGENYLVIMNYKENTAKALEVQKEIEQLNKGKAIIKKADISKEKEVKQMVADIIKQYGKIDILINNAGIAFDTELKDKTGEVFQTILNVNLIGTFFMSKYVGEEMLKRKYGKIVNISSTNGIDTYYPMSLDYDASKAGVISLTHNFAQAFAPYITVNTVAPGWIETAMTADMDPTFQQEETQKILLQRFGKPDEIASVVAFLVGDQANYINDAIIRIDGGIKR